MTAGDGYNFHFWPASGRTTYPAGDVAGCFVTVQARLILDDPDGADDRDQARYLMSVGGDWWESLTAQWDNWTTNADMGIGRFRFVTSAWQSFNMISVPVEVVRDNPPPFHGESVTQIQEVRPPNFRLHPIHPNPVRDSVILSFSLRRSENIRLTIHNQQGVLIDTLFVGLEQGGNHQLQWNTQALSGGVYFCKMQVGQEVQVRKLVLQR